MLSLNVVPFRIFILNLFHIIENNFVLRYIVIYVPIIYLNNPLLFSAAALPISCPNFFFLGHSPLSA